MFWQILFPPKAMGTCFDDWKVFCKFEMKLMKMRRDRIYKTAFFGPLKACYGHNGVCTRWGRSQGFQKYPQLIFDQMRRKLVLKSWCWYVVVGYCNDLDDPFLIAVPKRLLSEFGIHHRVVNTMQAFFGHFEKTQGRKNSSKFSKNSSSSFKNSIICQLNTDFLLEKDLK